MITAPAIQFKGSGWYITDYARKSDSATTKSGEAKVFHVTQDGKPVDFAAEVRGRELMSGLPKTVVISAAEVRKAIEEPVNLVVDAVKNTLDKCPPELAGDVMDRGIALTGGGALLRGLESRIREETGMPVQVADNPLDSVVLGTGKCVEDFETLRQVLVPDTRR